MGAKEDTSEHAPLCRWIIAGIKVDLMTSDDQALGFSNRWYAHALQTSRRYTLADGSTIELVSAVAFLATKLEAYKGRGSGDCLRSKDIEDVIAILDGRPEIVIEVGESEGARRKNKCEIPRSRGAGFRFELETGPQETPRKAAGAETRGVSRSAAEHPGCLVDLDAHLGAEQRSPSGPIL
jgi:hypothetical protein